MKKTNNFLREIKLIPLIGIFVLLLAFIPKVYGQDEAVITNFEITSAPPHLPGEELEVQLTVENFSEDNGANNFRYYLRWDYVNPYNRLVTLPFNPNPGAAGSPIDMGVINYDDVTEGVITITTTVPREIYKYEERKLGVFILTGPPFEYLIQDEDPNPGALDNPYPPAGAYNAGDMDFEDFSLVERSFTAPLDVEDDYEVFYAFDDGTSFSFEIYRNNVTPPATANLVSVQYRYDGLPTWTNFDIDPIDLNDINAHDNIIGNLFTWDPAEEPFDVERESVQIRIIQIAGHELAAGVDTWRIENFDFVGILNEYDTGIEPDWFQTWPNVWVENLVVDGDPLVQLFDDVDFEIAPPTGFEIADFNTTGADLYPGTLITYQIESFDNTKFPTGTIFEAYLKNDDDDDEILIGTLAIPNEGTTGNRNFRLPFRPKDNWKLLIRAELLDDLFEVESAPFEILGVDLIATLDLDETPNNEKLLLDGNTFLFPGSTIHIDYELGLDQAINTDDIQIVLEYNAGEGWNELKRQAFDSGDHIEANIPDFGEAHPDNIDFRLILEYGDVRDVLTEVFRSEDNIFDYENDFAIELPLGGTWGAGTKFSPHVFVSNTAAQNIIIEKRVNGVWTELDEISTLATHKRYSIHYARDHYDLVPAGELEVEDPEIRMRWADGAPFGDNKAILRGFRLQGFADELDVISNDDQTVSLIYPHLLLSQDVENYYEFETDEDNGDVIVTSDVEFTAYYQTYGMPEAVQIAAVLVNNGHNPEFGDPYYYLGSKAVGTNGQDSLEITLEYDEIVELFGDDLGFGEAEEEAFDIILYATDKDLTDPIEFFEVDVELVGFKDGFNNKPMVITNPINLSSLTAPLYLSFTFNDDETPDPLNAYTRVVLQYTTDNGANWEDFQEFPFGDNPVEILLDDPDVISAATRFRWKQQVELGDWSVENVQILSGYRNLVDFYYEKIGIPRTITLARQEIEVIIPDPIEPCEDYETTHIKYYSFIPDILNGVYTGNDENNFFEFDWEFLGGGDGTDEPVMSDTLKTEDRYVYGENTMLFTLDIESDYRFTEFKMTFPADVEPIDAQNIEIDGNVLTATVSGQDIIWEGDIGEIKNIVEYDFAVVFNVDTDVVGNIEVEWTIEDADGNIVEDAIEISPAHPYPDGVEFSFFIWNDPEMIEIAVGITEDGTYTATIPVGTNTGSYNIFAIAEEFETLDMNLDPPELVPCGPTDHILVYEDLFVIKDVVPEVYELEVVSVEAINDDPPVNDPEDDDFYFGSQMDVVYETFGPYPDDVRFEVVLVGGVDPVLGNFIYYNLGNSDELGEVTQNITIPSVDDFLAIGWPDDILPDIEGLLHVIAYTAENPDDELNINTIRVNNIDHVENDFVEVNRGNNSGNELTFDEQHIDDDTGVYTKRFAISRSLEYLLAGDDVFDNHQLVFDYDELVPIAPVNYQTIPRFQVSTDNGVTYGDPVFLFETNTYYIDIDEDWFDDASNVYFRWIQDLPIGLGTWALNDIRIQKGESNIFDGVIAAHGFITIKPVPEVIDDPYADYDNLNAYAWDLVDADPEDAFDPTITIGEDFDFSWSILLDGDDEPIDIVWPEVPDTTTVFEFYVFIDNDDPDFPGPNNENPENYILFATETTTDDFTVDGDVLPDNLKTGFYDIYVRAWILDDNDERVHGLPGYEDWDVDPDELVEVFPLILRNNVLIINEIAPDHLEIILNDIIAVNNIDPEDEDFYFGGEINVQYEVVGDFGDDVVYDVIIVGEDHDGELIYLVLGDASETEVGVHDLVFDIPQKEQFDNFDLDKDLFVVVVAFCPSVADERFILEEELLAEIKNNDHLLLRNESNFDAEVLKFEGDEINRYAITKKLSHYVGVGQTYDNHRLEFTYGIDAPIAPFTPQTVPRLEISYDNGDTYQNHTSFFVEDDYVIELDQVLLGDANNIHFRWIQDYPAGAWNITDIKFISGASNWCTGIASNEKELDLNEPETEYPDNVVNYDLIVGAGEDEHGVEEPVYTGQPTDFEWVIEDDEDTDNIWPANTTFVFTLDFEDPETEENIVLYQLVMNDGQFTATVPDYVPTGVYDVFVQAFVGDIDEPDHIWPDDPLFVKQILVINEAIDPPAEWLELIVEKIDEDNYPVEPAELEPGQIVTINYDLFGQWPAATNFVAALQQHKDGTGEELNRMILTEVSSDENTMDVQMPNYVVLHEDFELGIDWFGIQIYPYLGSDIDFGEQQDLDLFETSGNVGNHYNQDANRFAITEEVDLSDNNNARFCFEFYANNIPENPNTLVRLMISNDGVNWEELEVGDGYGLMGYLPANTAWDNFCIEVPAAYLDETISFRFKQEINAGAFTYAWGIRNLEIIADDNLVAYHYTENNPQEVIFDAIIGDYEWLIARDADDFEPVLYPGSEFEFTYSIIVDEDTGDPIGQQYPEGTTFDFFILDYPAEDDVFWLDVTEIDDDTYEYTLPQDIIRGNYDVIVHIENDGYVFVDVEDQHVVGVISIFNPRLIANYLSGHEVLYAGNPASFNAEIEDDVSELDTDWYYNLILHEGANRWLLESQLGSVEFTDILMPTFLNGNFNFTIEASIDNPMGQNYSRIPAIDDIELDDNDDFEEVLPVPEFPYAFAGVPGTQVLLTTVEMDLTQIHSIRFDLMTQTLNLTGNSRLILEYSTDEGETYQDFAFYPNPDFTEDDVNDWYEEYIELPEGARTENTIIRWRIEEFNKGFNIDDIALVHFAVDYTEAPMRYIATNVTIAKQRVDLLGTDALHYASCNEMIDIEIEYDIKGRFGEDVVWYLYANGSLTEFEFEGITEGSSFVTLNEVLDSWTDVSFYFEIEDETKEGYTVDVVSTSTESVEIEIVPELIPPTIHAQEEGEKLHVSCEEVERIVVVYGVQENFRYQLRDYVTGDLFGDAIVVDTDDEDLMDDSTYPYYDPACDGYIFISIGQITETTRLQVIATALDASGTLECDVAYPNANQVAIFDIFQDYALHYDFNENGNWVEATDGENIEICGNQSLRLSMGYFENGVYQIIPNTPVWYRGNLNNQMYATNYYDYFDYEGEYFAIVHDAECDDYVSVTVNVTIIDAPTQPVITVDGNTELCEDEFVTLIAPDGFGFYEWYRDCQQLPYETSSIVVNETGDYKVRVSDLDFDDELACISDYSEIVTIDLFNFNQITFANNEIVLCEGYNIAEFTVSGIQKGVSYYLVDNSTGQVFGDAFSGLYNTLTFETDPITQSTIFNVLAVSDNHDDCEKLLNATLSIYLDKPVYGIYRLDGVWDYIAEDQIITCCANDVVLSVAKPVGQNITSYNLPTGQSVIWYRNGEVYQITKGQNDWSTHAQLTVIESGVYHAKYINDNAQTDGFECEHVTEAIEVIVTDKPERPTLVYEGDYYVCIDEQVVLSTDEGYAYYEWRRNNSVVGNSSSITVNHPGHGTYKVRVSDTPFESGFGCASEYSTEVDIFAVQLNDLGFAGYNIFLCEPGEAVVTITGSGQQNVLYQLIDLSDNTLIGEPFYKSSYNLDIIVDVTDFMEIGIVAVHDLAGCEKEVHASKLEIAVLPTYHILAQDVYGVWEIADGQTYCEGNTLTLGNNNFDTNLYGGTVKWYIDGVLYKTGNNIIAKLPGEYHAKYTNGECFYYTDMVTIEPKPERPEITASGDLEFCEGEQELVLTATSGYDFYKWYKGSSLLLTTADNTLQVVETGEYTVVVYNQIDCVSEKSLPVNVVIIDKPERPKISNVEFADFVSTEYTGSGYNVDWVFLCQPGIISIPIENADKNAVYQLFDLTTGQAISDAVLGNSNLKLVSETIVQGTTVEVRATRLDNTGCASTSLSFDVYVLELDVFTSANTLIAEVGIFHPFYVYIYEEFEASITYQWYRNGQMIVNGGQKYTLNVYDEAEYYVVVKTIYGCEIQSPVMKFSGEETSITERTDVIMELYPNPATDHINVYYNSDVEEDVIIRVVDIRGAIVYEAKTHKSEGELEYRISIDELSNGSYMIHLIGSQYNKVNKFVKF